MDKSQKKELKSRYLEKQRKHDFAYQFWVNRQEQVRQNSEISGAILNQCPDEQLENKIVDYVLNWFDQSGKRPKNVNVQVWEREILKQLPEGVQAVFATYLFESDLSLNGSYYDFFYQNNGAFTCEALKGYQLMNNAKMVEIMHQCIGAYLKMKNSGEIEESMGVIHSWDMDEDFYISNAHKSFAELDADYQLIEHEFLKVSAIPGLEIKEKIGVNLPYG